MRTKNPVKKKILLLLAAGLALGLSRSPRDYFRVLKQCRKELRDLEGKNFTKSLRGLEEDGLIDFRESKDGSIKIVLTEDGRKRVLEYKFEGMKINKPAKWDGKWRLVMFDVPDDKKKGRDALRRKLAGLGFYRIQKSVFVYPYECKDEIDFVAEVFELRPYIRFAVATDISNESELKREFKFF